MDKNKIQYTYGTNTIAAARLEEIGKYFNPLSANFIQQFVPNLEDGVAVDLGCGPGFTTNMLAEVMCSSKTYGIDSSKEFIKMANQRFTNCKFIEHDITKTPFPVIADVMYARFLLCHLKDPLDIIELWTTQMNRNGLLFIEEIDSIKTDLEVFKKYLNIAEGIIAQQGALLYIGKILETAEYKADVLLNTSSIMSVANYKAASWFFPNTQTIWKENKYVLKQLSPEERDIISQELLSLKTKEDSSSNITWIMRRIVLRVEPI